MLEAILGLLQILKYRGLVTSIGVAGYISIVPLYWFKDSKQRVDPLLVSIGRSIENDQGSKLESCKT